MQELPDQTPVTQSSSTAAQQDTEHHPLHSEESPAPVGRDAVASSAPSGQAPLAQHPAERAYLQVPWSMRDILWGVIVGMVLLTGLALLLGMALNVYMETTGTKLPSATGLVTLLAELVLLLPVWWFGVRKYRLSWRSVGLRPFNAARSLGLGCLFLLIAYFFNVVWALFLALFNLRTQPELLPLFGSGIGGLLLALFTGGIIAPIAEEVFFRGFVFAGLYRHLGLRRALVLNAVLFALVHIVPTSWPPIFLLGVLFALLYEQTGSIWPAVAIHGAINSFSFVTVYLVQAVTH